MIACVNKAKTGSYKDTLTNILETKEFVVNTCSEWMADAVNYCSTPFDYGVSEIDLSGLTPIPSLKIKAPRIKEVCFSFFQAQKLFIILFFIHHPSLFVTN